MFHILILAHDNCSTPYIQRISMSQVFSSAFLDEPAEFSDAEESVLHTDNIDNVDNDDNTDSPRVDDNLEDGQLSDDDDADAGIQHEESSAKASQVLVLRLDKAFCNIIYI